MEAETLRKRLGDPLAEPVVDTLANMLADVEAETIGDTMNDPLAKAVLDTLETC